ncbi:histidinol dehydrogenase [soil metagenome]
MLRIVNSTEVSELLRDPVNAKTLAAAAVIVDAVKAGGDAALRKYAEQFNEIAAGAPLTKSRDEMRGVYESLPKTDQDLLQRAATRIRAFAQAQRASIQDIETKIAGGVAGQSVAAVERAGCYAPGGRYPLPSSVLMTAISARVAGVDHVIVASPKPAPITIAAAYVAGADMLLCAGGAQAIAALAFGTETIPKCDVVVGPGNRYVTAAKQLVSGRVGIDMLAGPSELVVVADASADPKTIAADLLAQAEHDPDALPILISTSKDIIDAANMELARQLPLLPSRDTASAALINGYAILAASIDEAASASDLIAPEHLELLCENAQAIASKFRHYGALFVGSGAAEVLGDYGAGPNHTLPTGGTARFTGGLSVFHFLRIRTWMRIDDQAAAQELVSDAVALARHEGLEAHARSAELRLKG